MGAGCGLARQQEAQAKAAALQVQHKAALQGCDEKVPSGNPKTTVARAQCINAAIGILRPLVPYPDLLDLTQAHLLAAAERVEKGQLTIAQASELIAQKNSEIAAEEQRRNLANRAVAAQEGVAAANLMAAGPRSCTRYGNTVNCF